MRKEIVVSWWTVLISLWATVAYGQQRYTGTVYNERQELLIGANVIFYTRNGTYLNGAAAGLDGAFALTLNTVPAYLVVSYTGYTDYRLDNPPAGRLELVLTERRPVMLQPYAFAERRSFAQAHPSVAVLDELTQLPTAQVSLPEVLNYAPGVFAHTGALNTNRLTIRGIGSRTPFGTDKVKAYLDEIPLTDGSGSSSLEDIDLGLVERVRVFRGPTASIFGAGLGGVVRLQTRRYPLRRFDQSPYLTQLPLIAHPLAAALPTSEIRAPHPFLTFQTGSFGTQLIRARLDSRNPGRWNHSLRLHHTQQAGYRANNRVRRTGFLYRGDFAASERHTLTLLLGHTDFLGFIPSALDESDYREDPSRAAANWLGVAGNEAYTRTLGGLTWSAALGRWQQKLTVFGSYRHNEEVRPFNVLLEDSRIGGARGRWGRVGLGAQQRWSVQGGFELLRERLDWQTEANADRALLSEQREIRQYVNVFTQTEYRYGDWRVWAGLNYNQTDYRLTDEFLTDGEDRSGRFDFDGVVSPYLHVVREKLLSGKTTLSAYAIVSHGFSPPSLEETLTPEGRYNPDIRPETGWNYETGLRLRTRRGLEATLSLYHTDIRNLLVARRTGLDQFIGVNAGRNRHRGIELDLRRGWNPVDRHHFLFSGQYSFQPYRFVEFVDGEADYSGNVLTGSPRHVGRVQVQHTWEIKGVWQLHTQLDQRAVGRQPITDANDIYADGYATLNWRSTVRLPGWRSLSPHLYFGINNVFDARYAAMLNINARTFGGRAPRYYYPGLPRHFYVGVRVLR